MRRMLALVLVLLFGQAASADLRQVESVGVVPLTASSGDAPRDDALEAAVARAVEGVAEGLLPAGWEERYAEVPAASGAPGKRIDRRLATALGRDPFAYATRYRILEDRGPRDALFHRGSGADREYVVVVEVFVDADRVADALRDAGWLSGAARADGSVRVVIQDLSSFGAYDALRRVLLDELGAESALPVELAKGRAELAVRGPFGAESLERALVRHQTRGLRVVPLRVEGNTLTLLVDYSAPPPAAPGPDALSGDVPGE